MTFALITEPQTNDPLRYCDFILPHVSRSFAIGINILKGQIRKNILAGYLLCRLADTIEDDVTLSSERKCFYLNEFLLCFKDQNKIKFISNVASELNGDPYHVNLVKNAHCIFDLYETLTDKSKDILQYWITEMVLGMIRYITKYPLGIRIANLSEYKEYCYYVAGTVGYMLTDLWKEFGYFIDHERHKLLHKTAGVFGEALQSINILKDAASDLKNANAVFLPNKDSHEKSVDQIIQLAEHDIKESVEYIQNIPQINVSIRFFCVFPLMLAIATLREIKKSQLLLNSNTTIKVTKKEVRSIFRNSYLASFSNVWLRRMVKKLECK